MLRSLPKPLHRIRFNDIEVNELFQTLVSELDNIEDTGTKDMLESALQTFASDGDIEKFMSSDAFVYRRKPVSIEEFMYDPFYLGLSRTDVFPAVHDACIELDSGKYVEAVLKGAIGVGKSTIANIMLARAIYKISCMRNPQQTFGVQAKSSLVFTIQSVRFNTAKKAVFEEFGRYINNSPYFTKIYPYDKKINSQMIFPQHNLSILPVSSSSTGAISMNVLGGILDEMNFMSKIENSKSAEAGEDGTFDQARRLYETLSRRRRSRFIKKGKLPGVLFLISSSRFPDDFTEKKAKEAMGWGGTDPSIFVYSIANWEAKRRDTFSAEEFRVLVGNTVIRSKILAKDEIVPEGLQVINVPMDFYTEFEKDIDGSIRDFAGITTLATKPFILKRNAIYDCMQAAENFGYLNSFRMEEADLSIGIPSPVSEYLRLDVNQPRVCHVDLGLRRDACGIAVGHVAGVKSIKRFSVDKDGIDAPYEILPIIAIDFVLRVIPPPNGEIDFSSVRHLITQMRDTHKLPIRWLTMDGFQSADSKQIMAKKGFATDYLSVEKIEPYRTLKDAIYDTRLLLPKHQFVAKELAELEHVVKNNKEKVDHRPNGSKDCADAVCGVISFLSTRSATWRDYISDLEEGGQLLFADPAISAKLANRVIDEKYSIFRNAQTGLVRRTISRRGVNRI
jgi:hypothetical protein